MFLLSTVLHWSCLTLLTASVCSGLVVLWQACQTAALALRELCEEQSWASICESSWLFKDPGPILS